VPADFPTIQAALTAAVSGDVVEVACGTYHEHDLVLVPGVTLLSETGQASCVTIDADGLGRVLSCQGAGQSVIEGLTLTGALIADSGGGVFADQVSLTIRNCRFSGNHLEGPEDFDGRGAGLYASSVTLSLIDCAFDSNSSHPGSFIGNAMGGGLYAISSSVAVERCSFTNNVASPHAKIGTGFGGGLAVESCTLTITDSIFESNSTIAHSLSSGGAIAATASSTVFSRCSFRDNACRYGGGGAVYLPSGDHEISWCTFVSNQAQAGAGSAIFAATTVELSQCTFAKNFFSESQIRAHAGASMTIDHCIVAFGPNASVSAGGTVSISCTDIFGNGMDWGPSIADQAGINGNFSADPLFCSLEANDFHLQWGSPCLPANSSGCDLIGALSFGGCGSVGVEPTSWARLKARWRE
jgi:hypothetical protein